MFGYVRPLKSELLMREFSRYRSVYCGICKTVSRQYGQVPRLTVSYDLTMLALLLLSLSGTQPAVAMETCILNQVQKKPVVQGGDVLERCAALSVLLGYHKSVDNGRDERKLSGYAASGVLWRAYRKAQRAFPRSDESARTHLQRLASLEKGPPDLGAADIFGDLLADLLQDAAADSGLAEPVKAALVLLGRNLGTWIYLCDAIDDLERDCNNGSWNPFSGMELAEARQLADSRMQVLEQAMDRTAALLPYTQDAGIVANVMTLGLPAVRGTILAGSRLGRF